MKPNFALDLSHDGIGLFHRSKGGWTLVGDVALDDSDLPQKVDILRKNAADLEKGGFSTKLIIPNSQILFTTLTAAGPDDIAREVQIRAGLEGLTPYEVGELVFDWQADGDTVKVAVLARETLAEAEAFAAEHRMNPVCFAARAGQNGFSGEAFFGKSSAASALLGPGQRVERDTKPVPRQSEQRVTTVAPGVEDVPAAPTPPATPKPADPKPGPVVLNNPAPARDATQADTALPPFPDFPETTDLKSDEKPADTPDATPAANLSAQDDLEQALATVPDPIPAPDAPDTEPASDDASNPAQTPRAKDTDVSAPVLAPFPPTPEASDDPEPLPPITPVIRDLPEDRVPEPPMEPTAKPSTKPGKKAKKSKKPVTKAGPTVEKPTAPELAMPTPPEASPSASQSEPRPEPQPDQQSEPQPAPAFSTRRSPQTLVTPPKTPVAGGLDAPARFAPGPASGTTGLTQPPSTAKRLGAAALHDDKGTPPVVAPSTQPHVPVTAPTLITDPEEAATKARPVKSRSGVGSGAALMAAARKGLSGAADQAGKAGKALASKTAERSAERKAAKAAEIIAKTADSVPSQPPAKRLPGLGRRGAGTGAVANATPNTALNTAIAPPPTGPSGAPGAKGATGATGRSEAEALTVFGAREKADIGGKPRYLGLVLTLVLLLAMAIAAVWSMFFLSDDNTASFTDPDQDFIATIETPASTPADAPAALLPPAAPDGAPDPDAPETTDLAPALTPAPEPLDQAAAEARYAATGIWQRAPEPAPAPSGDRVDDLYIASIDPELQGQDAIALPPTSGFASADTPRASATPPPPGTQFDLDENGLVVATPQGALSPDGVLVIAGQPPTVPGRRPDTGPAIAPEPAQPDLPRIRPTRRPEGLVESSQRATLGGLTLEQLATLRPQRRPARALPPQPDPDAVAEALAEAQETAPEEVAPPSQYAIATSPQPAHRPRNFARIVARATPTDNSDGSSVVAAAAATTTPAIPTRASVAQQATVTNAINLNRINLIGIYGSSSARRALVRMSNGRYVKVTVGDRLNGGKVTSITASKLTYQKGGKNHTLQVLPLG